MKKKFSPTLISRLLLTSLFSLPLYDSTAQEVQTDFDGDGRSEYGFVDIQSGGALSWSHYSLGSKATTAIGTLGQAGDHLIPARWRGRSIPEIGVIDEGTTTHTWRIIDENGVQQSRSFGVPGDIVISGADFNGNGYADAAVVRYESGLPQWYIYPDPFSPLDGGAGSVQKIQFGKSNDKFFFASVDGATDWLGRVAKGSRGRTEVRLRNFLTGQVVGNASFREFAGNGSLVPFPIKSSNGRDNLGWERKSGNRTTWSFSSVSGKLLSSHTLTGELIPVVGEFGLQGGEELGVKAKGGFHLFNPVSRRQAKLARLTGIAFDHININQTAESSTGGGEPVGDVVSCNRINSWPSSHIYKIIGSTHFSPTDVRRNTAGLIIRNGGSGPFPSCVQAVDRNGNVLALLGLYARNDGWAARYYAGFGCGAATPYSGTQLAEMARSSSGSSQILMRMSTTCYGPIDASRCVGSSQC